jgi:hypothetical protein
MFQSSLLDIINYNKHNITCPACHGRGENFKKCRGNVTTDRFWCGERYKIASVPGYSLVDLGDEPFWIRNDAKAVYQTESERAEQKALLAELKARQAKSIAERLVVKPTAFEANRQMELFLGKLTISEEFSQDLIQRGFTQSAIKENRFGSVDWGKAYLGKLSQPVTGFDFDGIYRASAGLILPMRDVNGLYHSFEIKTTKESADAGYGKYLHTKTPLKYTHLGYDLDYRLRNGERPLDVTLRDTKTIIFCEGILKGKLASFKTGYSFVTATSGDFTNSSSQLTELLNKYPDATYLFALDAKSATNLSVARKVTKSCQALKSLGFSVGLIDYGQWQGGLDIDEINHTNWVVRDLDYFTGSLYAPVPITGDLSSTKAYGVNNGETVTQALTRLAKLAMEQGYKNIIFNAPTGVGKTFSAAEFMRDTDHTVHYFARSQKSPDNEILKGFVRLPSRNTEVDANDYLGTVMTANNCHWSDKFQSAYSQGVDPGSLCSRCPFNKQCQLSSGEGYGFKNQYAYAVHQQKLLVTTQGYQAKYQSSAPSGILGLFEEASALTTVRSQKVSRQLVLEVSHILDNLRATVADVSIQEAKKLLSIVADILLIKPKTPFGFDISEQIEAFSSLDMAVVKAITPKIAAEIAKVNDDLLRRDVPALYDFVTPLVERLTGKANSQFNINHGSLEVVTLDENLRAVVLGNALNIFLDATASKSALCLQYGLDVSKTLEFTVKSPDYSNISFNHVPIAAGKNIGTKATQALNTVITQINKTNPEASYGLIDYKTRENNVKNFFDATTKLTHHADARGSNEYQDKDGLVILGVAKTNLGAALREYNIYTGFNVDLDNLGFQAYYQGLVISNTLQEFGRLRSMRRQGQFDIWLLSDKSIHLPHSITFKTVIPESIGATAYTRGDDTKKRIVDAALAITTAGLKLTQQAIATTLQVTANTVRRLLADCGSTWVELKAQFATIAAKLASNTALNVSEVKVLEYGADAIETDTAEQSTATTYQRHCTLLAIQLLRLPRPVKNRVMATFADSFKASIETIQIALLQTSLA